MKEVLVSHHLLLCATSKKALCCDPIIGSQSWDKLKNLVSEFNLDSPNRIEGIVLRSKVDCLRICNKGPILLIWPDGIWYEKVSPSRLEIIFRNHILKGKPIDNWIIRRNLIKKFIR